MNNLNDDTNILLANECLGSDSLSGITNAGVARDAHLARMEHALGDFQSPEAFEAVHNNYDSIYPKMSNSADRCTHYYSFFGVFSKNIFFAIAKNILFAFDVRTHKTRELETNLYDRRVRCNDGLHAHGCAGWYGCDEIE